MKDQASWPWSLILIWTERTEPSITVCLLCDLEQVTSPLWPLFFPSVKWDTRIRSSFKPLNPDIPWDDYNQLHVPGIPQKALHAFSSFGVSQPYDFLRWALQKPGWLGQGHMANKEQSQSAWLQGRMQNPRAALGWVLGRPASRWFVSCGSSFSTFFCTLLSFRVRQWYPHGRRSLLGCNPWGR